MLTLGLVHRLCVSAPLLVLLQLVACGDDPGGGGGPVGTTGAGTGGGEALDTSEAGDVTTEEGTETGGEADENSTGALEPGEPDGPDETGPPIDPTWILVGADGEVVPALVSPVCGDPESAAGSCPPGVPGQDAPYNCVQVGFFEDAYIMVTFALETGSATECYRDRSVEEARVYWQEQASCGDGAAFMPPGIERAQVVDGRLMFGNPGGDVIPAESGARTWLRNPSTNTYSCGNVQTDEALASASPVPDDVLGLLDNPPYRLELAY